MIFRILFCATSLLFPLNIIGQTLERRAFLGVQVSQLSEEQASLSDQGLNIVSVFEDSTASRFGSIAGQVILSANGQLLEIPADLPNALHGLRSGATVTFEFLIDSERTTRNVVLQAFPAEQVDVPTLVLWGKGDYIATEEDQRIIYRALLQREVDVELQTLNTDHYWREARDFATSYNNLRHGMTTPLQLSLYGSILEWLN